MPRKFVKPVMAVVALAVVFPLYTASADTIDFLALPTSTTPALQINNVTITAFNSPGVPGTVSVTFFNGLGVVGGDFDSVVDNSESLLFTFDNFLGSDVSYFVNTTGNGGNATVEAFGPSGFSLGTVSVSDLFSKPVSSLFNNQLISGFKVQSTFANFHRIASLTFTRLTEVHQADVASGFWDDPGNWVPKAVPTSNLNLDVFVDPTVGRTTFGPGSDNAVKSLTIGAQSSGTATLQLQFNKVLLVNQATAITPRGRLAGDGVLHSTLGITNQGEIDMGAGNMRLSGGTLTNSGLIRGGGQIDNSVINTAAGEVRVGAGQHLVFTQVANTNDGRIEVIGGDLEFTESLASNAAIDVIGGTLRVGGPMANGKFGQMSLRNATLRFVGGMTNDALMAMSFGTTDVFGSVHITAPGRVIVSGNSNATFFNNVDNDGVIQVATGSTAVYFGTVTGTGSFTGGGTNFFEGVFSPGSSPGEITIEGDAVMGSGGTLVLELAGNNPGVDYDRLVINGNLTAGGVLDVQLLNGFNPHNGDVFDVLDFGTLSGGFASVLLPTLGGGLGWDSSALLTTGTLTVVPEPATLVLTLAGLLLARRPGRSTRR